MIRDATFEVSSREFSAFLKAVESVNGNGVTINVHKDYLDAISLSDDNSSVVLYARIVLVNSQDIPDDALNESINVRDFKKFKILLTMNGEEDTFRFTVRENKVYFRNNKIKSARFVLGEIPMTAKSRITPEWFNHFKKEVVMHTNRREISNIVNLSRFSSTDADKVYFTTTEDGMLEAEIDNHDMMNTDKVTVVVGRVDSGAIRDKVIVKVKTLEMLSFAGEDILLETSDIGANGKSQEIMFISYINDNVSIRYLLNSMRS